MNDWSARDLQATENESRSRSSERKNFATSLGAHLVTREEDVYRNGDRYNLEMTAHVNGKLLSKGNFQDIYYTFAEMIERASEDVTLYPGCDWFWDSRNRMYFRTGYRRVATRWRCCRTVDYWFRYTT